MSEEYENDDSGPYCQHWGDPSDCDEVCVGCQHKCCEHRDDECSGAVHGFSVTGSLIDMECDCEEFRS